jgi:hypothetical protein
MYILVFDKFDGEWLTICVTDDSRKNILFSFTIIKKISTQKTAKRNRLPFFIFTHHHHLVHEAYW